MSDESGSNNDQKKLEKKLKEELPYKPYGYGIIWSSIVFILSFIAFVAFICFSDKIQVDDIVKKIALCLASLLAICSFIIYGIIIIKNSPSIRFAKLNELARISEKIDSEQTFKEALSLNIKYIEKLIPETENTEQNGKIIIEEKNYKFELYKKYMDTLADI